MLLPDTGDTTQSVRDHFTAVKSAFDYLVTLGTMTGIASNDGSGGSGFDFSDGANPSGHDAWVVYRMNNATIPWYIQMQWNWASGYGNNGGGPASGALSFGVAISIAMASDGSSPWNGTTNFNGADTKGTPVWVPNTGNLLVWPRSNSTDGSFATNRQRLVNLGDAGTDTTCRVHVLTDEDSLIILTDHSNNATYQCMLFSRYTARSGVTFPNGDCAYVMMAEFGTGALDFPLDTSIGSAVGTNTTLDGGLADADSSVGVKQFAMTYLNSIVNNTHQPNENVTAGPEFDEMDMYVYRDDTTGGNFRGLLGTIDFVKVTGGTIQVHSTNNDKTKALFGSASTDDKLVVPWDGSTTPGVNTTRAGIQVNVP